jgi:GT2 family glycosyltransferase
MNPPFLSVIIPTYERPALLRECLLLLGPERQGVPADRYEILVTDDGSRQPARPALEAEFPGIRWVQGPRRGPASNRNAGAAAAQGSLLIFLDDDCLPGEGWLSAYDTAFSEDPALEVAEGSTRPERERRSAAEYAPIVLQGGSYWSCNLAVRRELFARLGGFDERFRTAMEDNDFALRLRRLGARTRFVPEAAIIHPWRLKKIGKDGWKTDSGYLRDMLLYLEIHPDQRAVLTPRRIAILALRTLWADVTGSLLRMRGRGLAVAFASCRRDLLIAWQVWRRRTP